MSLKTAVSAQKPSSGHYWTLDIGFKPQLDLAAFPHWSLPRSAGSNTRVITTRTQESVTHQGARVQVARVFFGFLFRNAFNCFTSLLKSWQHRYLCLLLLVFEAVFLSGCLLIVLEKFNCCEWSNKIWVHKTDKMQPLSSSSVVAMSRTDFICELEINQQSSALPGPKGIAKWF